MTQGLSTYNQLFTTTELLDKMIALVYSVSETNQQN